MANLICTYKDYGAPGETTTLTFTGADLTAGNIVAQSAAADTLRQAAEALMVEAPIQKRQFVAWVNDTKVAAADPHTQREIKWRVRYHDAVTGKPQSLEIPLADLAKLDPNATDRILMTDADVLAFIAAFEAYQLSDAGNATVVDLIEYVSVKS